MNSIPSVDLRDFTSEDPLKQQKFVNAIGKAYEDIGFVALKGHFLEPELITQLYAEIKHFFALPLEISGTVNSVSNGIQITSMLKNYLRLMP
jgi:isopenicillin N synthase-like dioxygenase